MKEEKKAFLDNYPGFISSMSNGKIGYPERLTLEMTSYCNLKCWMCPKTVGAVNTLPNHLIEEDVILKAAKLFPKIEVLQLSGLWGEVFLHPEVYLRILKMAKREGCEVRTISNGTLLTPEISEQLVALGLDNLTISIDAATPKTYKSIRIGGNFKALIKNLKKLQGIKRKKGSSLPALQLAFVGMKRNIGELPKLVKLASKLGIDSIILQGMGEYEDTTGESLTYHHRKLGKSIYEKASRLGKKMGVNVALFPPDQFEESSIHVTPTRGNLNTGLKVPEGYRKACDVPWKETVITTTGDVLSCCAATKPLGNILKSSFDEIWFSQLYQDFRRRVLSDDPPLMCKACTGVGWRKPIEPVDYIKMGETDGQLGLGWYRLEQNEAWGTYRWSKERATFFIRNQNFKNLNLTMRIAGLPKEGRILINDVPVGSFAFRESKWKTLPFPLPEATGSEQILKVDIHIQNSSREGGDRRILGIALSEAFLS